jgi:hypothetical protein
MVLGNKNMDQSDIRIVEEEFKNAADRLILWLVFQEKFYENFLKIKLGFLAFLGVVLAIVFSDTSKFSCDFLFCFLSIVFTTFLLLVASLLMKSQDIYKTLKEQYRRVMLSKVRDIATKDRLEKYREEANNLLTDEDQIRQEMYKNEPIEKIIKYKENYGWRMELVVWAIIFLSVPILFLLELVGILR